MTKVKVRVEQIATEDNDAEQNERAKVVVDLVNFGGAGFLSFELGGEADHSHIGTTRHT